MALNRQDRPEVGRQEINKRVGRMRSDPYFVLGKFARVLVEFRFASGGSRPGNFVAWSNSEGNQHTTWPPVA